MTTTATSAGPRLGHRPALDGIRAVAVLLVLSQHLLVFVFPGSSVLPPGGYLGVDLFFVLSGFLITELLLEERAATGGVSYRSFYRRRVFRLEPAVAAFVVVQFAAAVAAGQSLTDEWHFWVGAFTYTSNWVMARNWSVPANTGHLWSLAVEEQFYLVWPALLVLALRRWRDKAVPILAAAGVAIAVASRVLVTHRLGIAYPWVYLQTETRLDALLLGAALAWAFRQGWVRPGPVARTAGWAGLAMLTWFVLSTNPAQPFLYTGGGYTVLAVAAVAVVYGTLDPEWVVTKALAWRIPVSLGRLSYSLYLWHMLVLFVLLSWLQHQSLAVAAIVFTGLSLLVATISYVFVERPFRARGRAEPQPVRVRGERPASVLRSRPAWVTAAVGVVALCAMGVVPAYAARHEIVARDRAAAAAAHPTATSGAAPPASALPGVLTVERIEPGTGTASTGVPLAVTVGVHGPDGAPVAGRPVVVSVGGESCQADTVGNGQATCTVVVPSTPAASPAGNVTVTATAPGDSSTPPAEVQQPVAVSPTTPETPTTPPVRAPGPGTGS